eukprot:TRINITY_DN17221_c0_g1_i1.p2 TRINITY_DN17221_c0_g1~~TRINITY_DN17221_c0_g1_i1.p2  ORF type:complete len:119 (-),score=16.06 TRINITY_DN17221_c0_g1_i1:257-613(-)
MNEQWQIDQAFNFITDLGADLESGDLNNDDDLQDYLNEVLEEINDIGLEYKVQYTVNNKGFGDVQIKEIIEQLKGIQSCYFMTLKYLSSIGWSWQKIQTPRKPTLQQMTQEHQRNYLV